MANKKYGKWYGRPNSPPLNWHSPDNPVIRVISGSGHSIPRKSRYAKPPKMPKPRLRQPQPDEPYRVLDHLPRRPTPTRETALFSVALTNTQWITILKALHLYGEMRGDERWHVWRKFVRGQILAAVERNKDTKRPVRVKFPLQFWRMIWRQVQSVATSRGDDWNTWFDGLSKTMTRQIRRQ